MNECVIAESEGELSDTANDMLEGLHTMQEIERDLHEGQGPIEDVIEDVKSSHMDSPLPNVDSNSLEDVEEPLDDFKTLEKAVLKNDAIIIDDQILEPVEDIKSEESDSEAVTENPYQ
jgi:hypothetical protein